MEHFLQEYVLPNIWGALAGIVGTVWLWWTKKPQAKVEQDGGIVENAKKVLEMSEDIADRLQKQLIASDEVIFQLKEKLRISIQEENSCKKTMQAIALELQHFKSLAEEQRVELEALREECHLLRLAIQENESKNISSTDDFQLN